MLCQRCSQPLPPQADRCLRCFALNPREPGPPLSIESDPPLPPLAVRFADDELPGSIAWQEASPEGPAPAPTDRFPIPATAKPIWTPLPPAGDPAADEQPSPSHQTSPSTPTSRSTPPSTFTSARPSAAAQLLAWSVDLAI